MLALPLLIALSLLAPVASQAQELPRLHWVITDAPPSVITDGPLQGEGYVQKLLSELLVPGLPDWRHEVQVGSGLRILRDLASRPNACTPYMTRTPARAAQFHLSRPWIRYLPVGVVMRRDDPGRPSAGTPLSLADYLASTARPRVAVVAGRSYTPALDAVLARTPAQVHGLPLTRATRSVLAMIVSRRDVDATLVGDLELSYFERLHPEWRDQLVWLPLKEQPSEPLMGAVGCARTAEGRRIIRAVNKLLEQPRVLADAQRYYEHWLPPASLERLRRERMEAPAPTSPH